MTGNELDILLTALATGTAVGFKDTAAEAIKDSYGALKILMQHKLEGKPKAKTILTEYEADPDVYGKLLKKVIVEEHLDQDPEVITAARQLMTCIHQQQAASGQFTVHNLGQIQGLNQGVYNSPITQNFGEASKGK